MVNESFRPANATAIAHYSTPQNRTQSFSMVRLAINLGWGVGGGLGGFLASINYHLLFWVDGCTNILAALLLLWILPRVTLVQQQKWPKETQPYVKVPSAFADKTFLYFVSLQLLFATCFFQLFTTIPLYFKEGLHLDEFLIGVVMSLNGIMIALFEMIIVFKLEGRYSYLILMTTGTILMAGSFFILNIPLNSGFLTAVLAMLVVTFAEMTSMPFMNSYYISRSTEGNRGQYAALYTMSWSAAQVIGSTGGTQIAHTAGFHQLWWIIGSICLVTAGGYYMLQIKR